MLLNLTLHHNPASDLGYLLHKHPDRIQHFSIGKGNAVVFYPEVAADRATASLYIELDPVKLVRGGKNDRFSLDQYVNDRPYTVNSYFCTALTKVLGSALNGHCPNRPELVQRPLPFEAELAVIPVRGTGDTVHRLFEPLGYTVKLEAHPLDPHWPEWGDSRYYTLHLSGTQVLSDLLRHLYVLIPVLDNQKHYFIARDEVEKLLTKGEGWLDTHPERDWIVSRYMQRRHSLIHEVMRNLVPEDANENEDEAESVEEKPGLPVHEARLDAVRDKLLSLGAASVADLGCGEGKLLRRLLRESAFTRIIGMDVSHRSLEIAARRLHVDKMSERQSARLKLMQGALTYRDERLQGLDAIALVEVIEHIDEARLPDMEEALFRYARPRAVVVTTPNAEYNVLFEQMDSGDMRHGDHRFEWNRAQFRAWAEKVAGHYGYSFSIEALGPVDPELGGLSQMAVFELKPD